MSTMFPGLRAAKAMGLVIKKVVATRDLFVSCEIHVAGTHFGSFINDGNGGMGRFVIINSQRDQLLSALAQANMPCLPAIDEGGPIRANFPGSYEYAESVFLNLIAETQALKSLKRKCKDHTLIVLKSNKPCEYTAFKAPFNERIKQLAVEKFGDTIVYFINEDISTL